MDGEGMSGVVLALLTAFWKHCHLARFVEDYA